MRTYYKIMDYKDGKVKTLFHANDGSKVIPVGEWVEASKYKPVHDGSKGTEYMSGWHVFESHDEAKEYVFKSFKNVLDKVIVSCYIFGDIRRKEHSRANVWLAQNIFIEEGFTMMVIGI